LNDEVPPGFFSSGPSGPSGSGGNSSLSCEQARRQIERMIEDRDLKEVERQLLLAHVRCCMSCKVELEGYRRLELRLKETFSTLDTAPHFNERLMAALPPPGSSESPEWVQSLRGAEPGENAERSGKIRVAATTVSEPERRTFSRVYWLPIALTALIAIALTATFFRTHGRESESPPPIVANFSGDARRMHKGIESALKRMDVLQNGDSVSSGDAPVNLTLTSGPQLIGAVMLAPRSKLVAVNRHRFEVHEGAAYFHIRKDRPKASANEHFEVDAPGIANVRVTGTAFIVDVGATVIGSKELFAGGALICVEEGVVEVRSASLSSVTQVVAGKECRVTQAGSSLLESDVKARLLKLQQSVLAALPVARGTPPAASKQADAALAVTPLSTVPFSWDMQVDAPLELAGKTLAEGIESLAEKLKRPPELLSLAEQMRGPLVSRTELSFSLHRAMPLRAVLAWMARDVGGGFEPGGIGQRACFTTAPTGNLRGVAGSGVPPDEIKKALDVPLEDRFDQCKTVTEIIERISSSAGVTLIAERGAAREEFERKLAEPGFNLPGHTAAEKLDALLKSLRFNGAWYEHVLFLASPSRIENLTLTERSVPVSPLLIGQPLNPRWLADLKELVQGLRYPGLHSPVKSIHVRAEAVFSDRALAETAVCSGPVELSAEGLKYRSGVLGAAVVSALLSELIVDAPMVAEISGLLSQPIAPGPVSDMNALIGQAAHAVAVKPKVRLPALSHQAFVFKGMSLGGALEWSTWALGYGLKLEGNAIVIADTAECYGAPALQVLPLASLTARKPALADEFPNVIARLLPQLYPAYFAETRLRSIGGKLIFRGDKRQLQLAQRLRSDLELALETLPAAKLSSWLPPFRQSINANLAEPFQGTGKLTRSFAGLLRQSELKHQLRCSVLVDPVAMREHAADQIIDLDVSGGSVGKVLDAIAAKARLKVTIEGDIIWLRPQR